MQKDDSLSNVGGLLLLITSIPLTSMAAGMGWGIRGQYGHETGAMIAGALASLVLVMLFIPQASSLFTARAAAMMTIGIGIGGSMTYGQTVGLTHDTELLGNWAALGWGMIGLFVKGGIWIGFGGILLGMGLGGKRYRTWEIGLLFFGLIGVMFFGVWLLNSPFDNSEKVLPWIYFSDNWIYEPGRDLKPRREVWGGLLLALLSLSLYVRFVRNDRLAGRMVLWGVLAGGLGFSGGQCVQAFARWNPSVFTTGWLSAWSEAFSYFNWWNMMETTFGLIWGAVLALGLWMNRRLVCSTYSAAERDDGLVDNEDDDFHLVHERTMPTLLEIFLFQAHLALLLTSEFIDHSKNTQFLEQYTDLGLLMSIIPLVGVVGGRYWPYLMLLPTVAAPIVGKTIRQLAYNTDYLPVSDGWVYLVVIPLVVMFSASVLLAMSRERLSGESAAAIALLLSTFCYFWLNTAFFDFAWPWLDEWTGRTPNQAIFSVCAGCLVLAATVYGLNGLNHRRLNPSA